VKFFDSLARGIRAANYYLYLAGGLCIVFIVLITLVDVIGRYFGKSVNDALEYRMLALACMVFLTWAHTQAEKGHISVDLLTRYFSRRVRAILGLCFSFLGLFLMSLFVWQGFRFFLIAQAIKEHIELSTFPVYPFKFLIFIGALGFCFQFLLEMSHHFSQLRRYPRGDSA